MKFDKWTTIGYALAAILGTGGVAGFIKKQRQIGAMEVHMAVSDSIREAALDSVAALTKSSDSLRKTLINEKKRSDSISRVAAQSNAAAAMASSEWRRLVDSLKSSSPLDPVMERLISVGNSSDSACTVARDDCVKARQTAEAKASTAERLAETEREKARQEVVARQEAERRADQAMSLQPSTADKVRTASVWLVVGAAIAKLFIHF